MNHRTSIFHFFALFFVTLCVTAQPPKTSLDHTVYDEWNQLSKHQLSNDGRWVSFEINPQRGDGWLHLYDLSRNVRDSVARGRDAVFSPKNDFVAYRIHPKASEVRQAKADGKKSEEMPKDMLGITLLPGRTQFTVENMSSFVVSGKESGWLFYHLAKLPGDSLKGTDLFAHHPASGEKHVFEHVTDYAVSENGLLLVFVTENTEPDDRYDVHAFHTNTRIKQTIFSTGRPVQQLTTDAAGKQASFVHAGPYGEALIDTQDDASHDEHDSGQPAVFPNELFLWQGNGQQAFSVAGAHSEGMPEGWHVSGDASPFFSDDGSRLFFGTAPQALPQPADTLLPEEKHSVDVWHYKDPLIQPMQLVQLSEERKRSYRAVYHIDSGGMVQLADEDMPEVMINRRSTDRVTMGQSMLPYLIQNSFVSGDYRDVYLVDLHSGERELFLEKHRGSVHLSRRGDARLSPGGNYLLYYCQQNRSWYARSVADRSVVNLFAGITTPFFNELHDTPDEPDPYGVAGWIENDSYVLIYDRFDVWKADPSGKEPAVSLTGHYGRNNNISLRFVNLDPDAEYIGKRERIMLRAFHMYNKQSGYYTVSVNRPGTPERLIMEDAHIFQPVKAADAQVLLWRRSTFREYPDLWVSNMRFADRKQLSVSNPQQQDYLWGDVLLVDWVSFSNDSLQGLLYLPENIDETKKYPMIVYFYERFSDRLHSHFTPAPSRSTLNISYSVSNGYVVFVPDIKYTIGYPGQSAYDAIVSGTKAMLNQFSFIDRHNIGIQGQSWAGYQIAWIITQTDMFRAAMAGAPVSNMISAYGGIRWATGMSRIYQYEETQSRIGGTIWDQTLRYIENSPVFFANRVNTPLLMMHNDADGAVPWYQGIEYFMALRRLGKPVWMLNYNDEAHNLTRWPNRVDLSHRMYEFFDHFLKGAPAPSWMTEGVPAIRKNM
ncbi:MAG: prolyl oligopeptidase family serine peptidase [Bacteroidales bacterium]|nr:prolyl oligopeptidase family serine peptidase [Bacteroidales bacterium]